MKVQVTKKQIKANYSKIISIGYCDAQYLLNYSNPFGYSAGVDGWSCDYYQFDNIIISTGYNPIGEKPDYKLIKRYEEKAQKICFNYYNRGETRKKLEKLIKKFILEVTK